jgi:hypothetical protein
LGGGPELDDFRRLGSKRLGQTPRNVRARTGFAKLDL